MLKDEIAVTLWFNAKRIGANDEVQNDALIFKTMKSKSIEILENQKPLLRFKFDDFPNFGIWTKVNAPFICLEPWLGYSDTFKANGNLFDKEGSIALEENATFDAHFDIEIL